MVKDLGPAEISFLIISKDSRFVKKKLRIISEIFGKNFAEVIKMKKWKDFALFCLGGVGYVGLELLWRGRSHVTMFLAGGLCFLLLGKLREKLPQLGWPGRAVLSSGVITAVELATGLLFNRNYGIWDYRGYPMNFLGQICLPFSLLWAVIGVAAMELYRAADRRLDPA